MYCRQTYMVDIQWMTNMKIPILKQFFKCFNGRVMVFICVWVCFFPFSFRFFTSSSFAVEFRQREMSSRPDSTLCLCSCPSWTICEIVLSFCTSFDLFISKLHLPKHTCAHGATAERHTKPFRSQTSNYAFPYCIFCVSVPFSIFLFELICAHLLYQ